VLGSSAIESNHLYGVGLTFNIAIVLFSHGLVVFYYEQ
jgi:hypothetical protein